MPRQPIFEWHGKEYASPEKSADWYWALGIVAVGLIIVCILFNDFLLAVVVLAGAVTIGLLGIKRPRIHRFAITESGIDIDTHHYSFQSMLHFTVYEYLDDTTPPALSIKTKHLFAPHLLIPIIGYDPIDIYDYIALHLPDGKHEESFIDHVVEAMGL